MSLFVTFPASPSVRNRYLRGNCHILAKALSRETKLPLWGMFDPAGNLHHVFVLDEAHGRAIDVRGAMPLPEVSQGSSASEGAEMRAVTWDEVLASYFKPSPKEMADANALSRRIVDRINGVPEVGPPERPDDLSV